MDTRWDLRTVVRFGLLTLVAVGGSLIYGAAAGAVVPRVQSGALLLTLSTGCSWVLLGLLLCAITHKPIISLADACLVTMAFGEGVLLVGALVDWGILVSKDSARDPLTLNVLIVLVSNIVMAWVFVFRLRKLGVGRGVSLSLWLFGLNASWPGFLWLFSKILPGGR